MGAKRVFGHLGKRKKKTARYGAPGSRPWAASRASVLMRMPHSDGDDRRRQGEEHELLGGNPKNGRNWGPGTQNPSRGDMRPRVRWRRHVRSSREALRYRQENHASHGYRCKGSSLHGNVIRKPFIISFGFACDSKSKQMRKYRKHSKPTMLNLS